MFYGRVRPFRPWNRARGWAILFRTLISLVIAVSVIRSLEILSLEMQRKIEELEQMHPWIVESWTAIS